MSLVEETAANTRSENQRCKEAFRDELTSLKTRSNLQTTINESECGGFEPKHIFRNSALWTAFIRVEEVQNTNEIIQLNRNEDWYFVVRAAQLRISCACHLVEISCSSVQLNHISVDT